jgi:hypothetical protein
LRLLVLTRDRGLALHEVEPVVRTGYDSEIARHARRSQAIGVGDVFVVEQVASAGPDPSGCDPGEVAVAGGRGQRRRVVLGRAEIGTGCS